MNNLNHMKKFENKKNDPIRFGSLTEKIISNQGMFKLMKVMSNTAGEPKIGSPQITFFCNDPLFYLILENTNLKFFNKATDSAIVSYGCHRLETSGIMNIPLICLN